MSKKKLKRQIKELSVELCESSDSLCEWAMRCSYYEGLVASLEKEVVDLKAQLILLKAGSTSQ